MDLRLTDEQHARREAARRFAADVIEPWAERIDREDTTPPSLQAALRASGYLGAALPTEWGGGGIDPVSHGLMTEEIGRVSSSVRSLLTVHDMGAQAITRFGTAEQKARWLPPLCAGEKIIAFALSEPDVGSAAQTIQTRAVERGNTLLLTGVKRWITYGLVADLFLVFAQCDGMPVALVVERETAGLHIKPVTNVFGMRGAMLAELRFDGVAVSRDCQIGPTGAGITFVASAALDHGRFSVAWGSTGIIQACLHACLGYVQQRRQGASRLKDYQLIRRQLADMLVAHTAARALCYRSACLRAQGDPRAVMETSLAKYHASAAAMRVATDAVHMHGANGCSEDYPVSRYLRDATVMGIVEGTHEMHQLALASYAFQRPYLLD
ncbi:acyl-CoA dehydrogenase family protein [Corallococcus caeni]|uniref:acyl-CoA dehydrogenase family protein n=1 Tax=Corallococcus caeni TaxID=3082388 RepID=UPI0029563C87|nr:acyl-CoA dehydrogenase family protein [Corallococcus sp. KH5-1]